MGNMCCKREMYAPNGTDTDQSRCKDQQQQNGSHQQHLLSKHPAVMSSAYHSAGDDCAINELLEGRMDLDVLLPDGRKVRLTVERRTPMMDLLVQAASATKISPGGHVIHVFGEGDKGRGAIQYKPSTPIGTLDTKTICIVPKKESSDPLARKLGKTANRPFEPTFRVQVHLPRNQLTVLRVSPRIKISELKSMVCKEKGLDMNRYQLVRPSGPTQPLSGDMTLADYGSTEITLLSNSSIEAHICNSNSHIIPYSKRTEEPKRRTGILRLLTEDANNKVNETANCKSISQVDSYQRNKANKSDEVNVHQNRYKPKKRRPAPPPPPPVLPEAPSHSRQSSSDSSGYHEATSSFLHEEHSGEEKASSDSSGVSSLGAKDPPLQPSPPPIPNSKKKKAPAPPPPPPITVQKEKPTHRPAPKSPSSIQQELIAPKISAKEVTTIEAEDSGNEIKTELQEKTVHVENNSVTSDLNAKDSVVPSQQTVENKISCESSQESSKGPSMVKEFTISPYSTSKGNKLKADFQIKTVDVENISATSDVGAKDSVILLKQTVESKLSCESSQKCSNDISMVKEFTISPYSSSKNNPIIQDNAVVLEDNLIKEDCLTQNNNNNNNSIIRDHIPNPNHAIVKGRVLKEDAEGKLDLLRLRESEGQPLMTVAAKVLPTANVSADTIKEKQSSRVETSPVIKAIRETSSFVSDVHRSRTPEDKVEKERVPRKGEAVSTRVALVALNARIEQDVTQQEIASSIQAAFHSVECSPQPSLLSIKQRSVDDSHVQITQDHSLGPFESIPPKTTTTVKVPLTLDTVNRSSIRSSPEITRKFGDLEREALLIDEEPLPRPASSGCAATKNLKRSSSLLNFADTSHRNSSYTNIKRSRHLQRSLSDLTTDEKEDFETEQERLHREYIKLQRQFILWQQQLMNNHAMLREECIVPQYARTLRQSHSLPEGEDSFEEVSPSVPLVSRSLSYEPTKDRCSTLPRSAINITSLELGSIPIGNGTSTLRSSKTKSYFKPPQVRVSTKSRQRLPPEIKKEGDVDITDDTKMLTTILPSFESLKLITENHDEDSLSNGVSRLKDMNPVTKHTPTVGRKVPVVHLSSTFPKMNARLNNGDKTADSNLKYVNGDTGQSKPQTDCSKATEQQSQQQKSQPPPPPPPVPTFGMSKSSVKESTNKSTGQRNGVERRSVPLDVDPREQLMLEIRKFGGRTALRKISLAS